nr:alpha-1,2-mannosyltransferase ALG9 isoform X3 [Zootoca vivipara]
MAAKGPRQRPRGGGGDAAAAVSRQREEAPPPATEETKAESSGSKAGHVWAPEGSTAFKCLISARFCAALLSNISDCDETFNYWEPMHYLVYGKGFQTWEYSPVYAIRSYAYLWLHALPALFHARVLQTNKVLIFYFLRCLLAFLSCVCELYFYKAVCKKFGLHVSRLMLAFLVLSTGMFCSAAAFLPSSFCMYSTVIAMTGWYMDKISLAVLGVAAGAIVGWPFSAALGLPIALDFLILKRRWRSFLRWFLVALVVFLVPLVAVDSYHYGKLVITPLNIVLYNVFTPHGPDLYGLEFIFGTQAVKNATPAPWNLGYRALVFLLHKWLSELQRGLCAGTPGLTPDLPHGKPAAEISRSESGTALLADAFSHVHLDPDFLQPASQRREVSVSHLSPHLPMWCCRTLCPSEMLPLHISTLPPGALHGLFKLAGPGDHLCLWAPVLVALRSFVQRLVLERLPCCLLVTVGQTNTVMHFRGSLLLPYPETMEQETPDHQHAICGEWHSW